MKRTKHSQKNLGVIENFILFFTHVSHPSDGDDPNFEVPNLYTAKSMYEMAVAYTKEDHVDGEDNPEDHIVTFAAESSFHLEDKEKKYPECVIIVADFGDEVGTATIGSVEGSDVAGVQALIEFMANPKFP